MRHTGAGTQKSTGRAFATAAAAVALFVVVTDRPSTQLHAQSAAASQAIPKLAGIWHRTGPLNGKRDPAMAPTNRAVGFEKAYENSFSPTYDCVPIPMPAVRWAWGVLIGGAAVAALLVFRTMRVG